MSDRILVFVPCYNCGPQIGRVLSQFAAIAPGLFAEIIVVDNRSTDDTVSVAAAAIAGIGACRARVVRNRDNYSLGGSHKAAFAYASANGFSHVVVLHGDDQGHIDDLLPILARGDHRTHDACLGARFMPGSQLKGYSFLRILGNRVFNGIFSLACGAAVHDLGSGLNVFGRRVFTDPDIARHSDDLRFNVYLLLSCIDKGVKLEFFPISWREDDQVSNVKLFSQARKTLAIAFEYLLRRDDFRSRDHRAVPRAAYEFELVAAHETGPPIHGESGRQGP